MNFTVNVVFQVFLAEFVFVHEFLDSFVSKSFREILLILSVYITHLPYFLLFSCLFKMKYEGCTVLDLENF